MRSIFWILVASAQFAQPISEWAFGGPDHRLYYKTDGRGNRIMDFSAAGYRGGGVKLPSVSAAQRLTPVAGDNTARIQASLDNAMGAVVLEAGEYDLAGTLSITRSGVVLRGEKGSSIRLTGKPHRFLEIRGVGTWREEGPLSTVLDQYVPVGSNTLRIRKASTFRPGDHVLVLRPVTAEWIRFEGMDPLVHGGRPEACMRAGSMIRTDRVIEASDGDRVTLDVPLSDALDSRFTAASLVHYSFPGRITEVGVEGLRIVAPLENGPATGPQFAALLMDAVEDGWVRDLDIWETQSGIVIGSSAKRLTLINVSVTHSKAHSGSVPPADFTLQGTQTLLDRCRVTGESTPVITASAMTGPVVLLNFTADHGGVAPHEWTTGLLVDSGKFPGGTQAQPGLALSNGATAGSDQGWGAAWAVAWNVSSPFLLVQSPPGALNWCIGCAGVPVTIGGTPNAIFDSHGTAVAPASLYLHQLQDRLGPTALANIGYQSIRY